MTEHVSVSRELIQLVLDRLHADQGRTLPVISLLAGVYNAAGVLGENVTLPFSLPGLTSDPQGFKVSCAAAVLSTLTRHGVPEHVAERLVEQLAELSAEQWQLLEWFQRTLPAREWWTSERVTSVVHTLYSVSRGEPSADASQPVGKLFAALLAGRHRDANAVGFASVSGLVYVNETRQALAPLTSSGEDLTPTSFDADFAGVLEAVLTDAHSRWMHATPLNNRVFLPPDERYFHVNGLANDRYDVVFGAVTQPSWSQARGVPSGELDSALSHALAAVRDGGTLYLLVPIDALTHVPVQFTDKHVFEYDLLSALVLFPSRLIGFGDYDVALLVVELRKTAALHTKTLVIDARTNDSDAAEMPNATELVADLRLSFEELEAGSPLTVEGARIIDNRELAVTHYQAALHPAREPQEVFNETIAALKEVAEQARRQRIAATQEFSARVTIAERVIKKRSVA